MFRGVRFETFSILCGALSGVLYTEREKYMSDYRLMAEQIKALAEEDGFYVPVMSNVSSLIFNTLEDLNWAGFYIVRDGQLVLAPFQGKVACIHIAKGRGVCGTAWAENKSQLVKNVHEFAGHIACDGASNSEVVVPIHDTDTGAVRAVLDIDSPLIGRFDESDLAGFEEIVRVLEECLEWN